MEHTTGTIRTGHASPLPPAPVASWGHPPTATALAEAGCRDTLGRLLGRARQVTGAEGAAVYSLSFGMLVLCSAQNSRIDPDRVSGEAFVRLLPLSDISPAGMAVIDEQIVNIPDVHADPRAERCRLHRQFDSATGYHTVSLLTVPLICPDGQCTGALELTNRADSYGQVQAFDRMDLAALETVLVTLAMALQTAAVRDDLKQANVETIVRLSLAAEFREDPAAANHVRRMSHVAGLIGAALGLPSRQIDLIRFAAPMHDLGKIGIPDAILYKPGRLTDDEREVIQTHSTIGARILNDPHSDLMMTAHEIALTHHERWDGGGYPQGLAGTEIPLVGRIAGLADVFDALISPRCYKDPFPVEKVLDIIRAERGKHFDPAVVDAFFTILDDALDCYEVLTTD